MFSLKPDYFFRSDNCYNSIHTHKHTCCILYNDTSHAKLFNANIFLLKYECAHFFRLKKSSVVFVQQFGMFCSAVSDLHVQLFGLSGMTIFRRCIVDSTEHTWIVDLFLCLIAVPPTPPNTKFCYRLFRCLAIQTTCLWPQLLRFVLNEHEITKAHLHKWTLK